MKTGKLLDVDIHHDFRTLLEHNRLLVHLMQNNYAHKGEGSFLPENSQDLSCTNPPRRTISGDVCRDSAEKEATGIEYTLSVRVRMPRKQRLPLRISQRRSMKQDVSDSTISFTC